MLEVALPRLVAYSCLDRGHLAVMLSVTSRPEKGWLAAVPVSLTTVLSPQYHPETPSMGRVLIPRAQWASMAVLVRAAAQIDPSVYFHTLLVWPARLHSVALGVLSVCLCPLCLRPHIAVRCPSTVDLLAPLPASPVVEASHAERVLFQSTPSSPVY